MWGSVVAAEWRAYTALTVLVCCHAVAIPIATDIYDHCVAGLEAYSDEIQEAEQKIVQEGAT